MVNWNWKRFRKQLYGIFGKTPSHAQKQEYVDYGKVQEHAVDLLHSIYPKHIVSSLLQCDALTNMTRVHENACICFADIKSFTQMCSRLTPEQVTLTLNTIFCKFDALLDKYNIYKIETIGDCYVCCSGIFRKHDNAWVIDEHTNDHMCQDIFDFAKEMIQKGSEMIIPEWGNKRLEFRIGIHMGKVISGVISSNMPRFQLFGETMNLASRMESTGQALSIHVSEFFFHHLPIEYQNEFIVCDSTFVKGYGAMTTYMYRVMINDSKGDDDHEDLNDSMIDLIQFIELVVGDGIRNEGGCAPLRRI